MFELGISSSGGCLWSTDKDDRKLVSILAHCVNSVSSLALDFGHCLALDRFRYYASSKLTVAMRIILKTKMTEVIHKKENDKTENEPLLTPVYNKKCTDSCIVWRGIFSSSSTNFFPQKPHIAY